MFLFLTLNMPLPGGYELDRETHANRDAKTKA